MRSSPPLIGDTAAIIRIVDDLPAPLGPRNPNASPRRTSRSMPFTASKSPNDLRRPVAEIIVSLTSWSLEEGTDTFDRIRGRPSGRPNGTIVGLVQVERALTHPNGTIVGLVHPGRR